jgi:hypothetical protein
MKKILGRVFGLDTSSMNNDEILNIFKSHYEEYYGENGAAYQNNLSTYNSSVIASGTLKRLSPTKLNNSLVDPTLT